MCELEPPTFTVPGSLRVVFALPVSVQRYTQNLPRRRETVPAVFVFFQFTTVT